MHKKWEKNKRKKISYIRLRYDFDSQPMHRDRRVHIILVVSNKKNLYRKLNWMNFGTLVLQESYVIKN